MIANDYILAFLMIIIAIWLLNNAITAMTVTIRY